MFFLGISAHLFIYLLVPAFLIVCFYFRGVAGGSEVDPILPENVVYEYTCLSFSAETYIYKVVKREKQSAPKENFSPEYSAPIPVYSLDFYLTPTITRHSLRAPPRVF